MVQKQNIKNINNYLLQRLPYFNQKSYYYLDSLVFSILCYLPFEEIVKDYDNNESFTIEKFTLDLKKSSTYNNLSQNKKDFINNISINSRYRFIRIDNFSYSSEPDKDEQFAAMAINFFDNYKVIVFRGTDNSINGWKEDFNLSWAEKVPAQELSKEYVNTVGLKYPYSKLYLTGHSKGGHLAKYACIASDYDIRNRIIEVHNFDGPGFNQTVLEKYKENYDQMKNKLITYIPQTSIIGMLLKDPENTITIYSNAIAIKQHDPFTWIIDSGELIFLPNPDHLSRYINQTLDDTLDSLTASEKETFVQALFLLGSKDADKFSDFGKEYRKYFDNGDYIRGIAKIIYDFVGLSGSQRRNLIKVLYEFYNSAI